MKRSKLALRFCHQSCVKLLVSRGYQILAARGGQIADHGGFKIDFGKHVVGAEVYHRQPSATDYFVPKPKPNVIDVNADKTRLRNCGLRSSNLKKKNRAIRTMLLKRLCGLG